MILPYHHYYTGQKNHEKWSIFRGGRRSDFLSTISLLVQVLNVAQFCYHEHKVNKVLTLCLYWKWSTSLFVQQPWKVAAFAGGAEKEVVAAVAEASAVVILAPSARLLTEVTRTS